MSEPKSPNASGKTTIKDVAEHAKVSIGTVSRVLNEPNAVREETRNKVLAAIEAFDYIPNLAAQTIRRQGSRTIACVVPDIRNRLYALMVGAIKDRISDRGYQTIVLNTGHMQERELRAIEVVKRYDVDGMVFISGSEDHENVNEHLRQLLFPVLQIERATPPNSIVRVDHGKAVRLAFDHLMQHGHRNIGLISPGTAMLPSRERLQAFISCCREKGCEHNVDNIRHTRVDASSAYSAAYDLMNTETPPSAVISLGGTVLEGVLNLARMQSIKIPDDLSLVAIGENEVTQYLDPPLTTVVWSFDDIASHAVSRLFDMIIKKLDKDAAPTETIVDCRLVTRQSVCTMTQV